MILGQDFALALTQSVEDAGNLGSLCVSGLLCANLRAFLIFLGAMVLLVRFKRNPIQVMLLSGVVEVVYQLAVRALPSATSRQGTSQSLGMRRFLASSLSAAERRPPATTARASPSR